MLLLGLFKLRLKVFDGCLARLILLECLINLLLQCFGPLLQALLLNLEGGHLISLRDSLAQLAFQRLSDKDSFIFLLLHHGHLFELLFLLLDKVGILLFESAHVLQLALDLLGDGPPRSLRLVVNVVQVVEVDLA